MLVLSRKPGESITFPELGIKIVVVRLSNGRATLGVEAPRDVGVSRTELLEFLDPPVSEQEPVPKES